MSFKIGERIDQSAFENMYGRDGVNSFRIGETIGAEQFQSMNAQPQANETGFAQGVSTGAAKGILGMGLGIGQVGRSIQRGISGAVDKTFGTQGFGLGDSIFDTERANEIRESKLTPDAPGEGLGKFATDVASFAIPGGAAMKATRGLGAGRMIAGQAASDATVTSLSQGGVDRSTLDSAIIGTLFPSASVGLKALAPYMGSRIINSLIKPLKKDFAFGKNPGRTVAEEGITANSIEDLATQVSTRRQQVGQEIGDRIAKETMRFNVTDLTKPLDDALQQAKKSPRTNREVITRLQNLKDDLLQVTDEGAQRKLANLTAKEVFDIKKEVADLTKFTGNASDDEIANRAMRSMYGKLKGELDKIDGLAPLNEKYANFSSAEVAAQNREILAQRANLFSLPGINLTTGSAIVAGLATGAITPALIAGATAQALRSALGTTAAKTRMASWLAGQDPQTLRSLWKEAPKARAVIQAALFGEETVD